MKKILLLAALFAACSATAQQIDKQTFVYAVKGTDTLRMDRYTALSQDNTPRPCLLFVFGGGFRAGERDASRYLSYFDYYASKGYQVVSIDYRLGLKKAIESGSLNQNTFPQVFISTLTMAVEDLYTATEYILDNAAAWGVDPKAIVASGSSAGAITVLMGEYGLCNSSALAGGLLKQDFNYAGVISYAGAIFAMSEDLVWRKTPAPMMLFHGDADTQVPYDVLREQGAGFFGSKYIAAQLTEKRIPHWFYSVANTGHIMADRPMTGNRYEVDAFLQKFVQDKQPLVIDTYVTPLDIPETKKIFTLSDYVRANFGQ